MFGNVASLVLLAMQAMPPPPMLVHDRPFPPKVLIVDKDGNLLIEQSRAANLMWVRNPRGAFFICYRNREGVIALPESSKAAMNNVTKKLKDEGAEAVFSTEMQGCSGQADPRWRHQSMVEIIEILPRQPPPSLSPTTLPYPAP